MSGPAPVPPPMPRSRAVPLVPLVSDLDRTIAENLVAILSTPCGRTWLDDPAQAVERVAEEVARATLNLRAQFSDASMRAAALMRAADAARTALDHVASNPHVLPAAWPADWRDHLVAALRAVGSPYGDLLDHAARN